MVDYALRLNNSSKVFVEAKKGGEDLEKHEEQVLGYSFREGVELAILTNGGTWLFYLPTEKGNWSARRFYAIDVSERDAAEAAGLVGSRADIRMLDTLWQTDGG